MPSTTGRTAADRVPREIERDRTVLRRPPRRHLGHEREPGRVAPDLVHRLQHRVAPITEVVEIRRAGASCGTTAGMYQPCATDAASAMPRRLFPPSHIGGPPGVNGPGRFVAPASRSGPAASRPAGGWRPPRRARAGHAQPIRSGRNAPACPAADPERDAHRHASPPEADDEPPAGDVIEQRRLLRQHDRMAERVRQHAMAEPFAGDVMGQRGHRGERSQLRPPRSTAALVMWSFIQTDSNTSCSPIRAQAASRVGQSTSCGEVLMPIEMRPSSALQQRLRPHAGGHRTLRRGLDQCGVLASTPPA